eukprot:CAMPEP_0197173282 /NCGR_PEP_ID=MMETSP1423-20130617/280_1 /TAXON_ID=476441 /ORGANISM="Pseudo-nitzschia heimii, Strain UNC1101" /LENGTH=864 /DNA_ID=CAMNT_0042622077 /DNA_START=38 /DNA_END=2632 /DNA_ORIENTATION=-
MIINAKYYLALVAALATSADAVIEYEDELNHPWYADDCWPDESPAVEDPQCPGAGPIAMTLDFRNSDVGPNNLQEEGGAIRYKKVGKVGSQDIDLEVTVVPGTHYYSKKANKKNGKHNDFGRINLWTDEGEFESGRGAFRFCFYDHESGGEETIESFRFTVNDVDERNNDPDGMKERIVIDATQAKDYFVYPDQNGSEIRGWCTSNADPPCASDDPMIFHSSTYGTKNDDPTYIDNLTDRQMKRSVTFYFENTHCFDLSYEQYCHIEEEGEGGLCSWYGGTNMLFGGDAPQVVEDGLCISTDPNQSTESPSESPTESTCLGQVEMETSLDFFNAELTDNNLQYNGTMRFENIGVVRDNPVDLVISVVPGTDYYSEKADSKNGLLGEFGQINLFTELGDFESGRGSFRFCFEDHETGEITSADSFIWTVYDVDERNDAIDGIKEKVIMDMSQAQEYMLYPDAENSEIEVSCEDPDEAPPCSPGTRTVFHSSTKGVGADNPDDPNNMTEQQKKRSIVYVFKNTDCWDFTYDHYCQLEQDTGGQCAWYGGGNFLFAGSAQQIIEEGECLTNAPTQQPMPSASPTGEPSMSPTGAPNASPSASPTDPPSKVPTAEPSASPTGEPSNAPTGSPNASPSASPTDSPSAAPTAEPSASPTGEPSKAPTAAPSDAPSNKPSLRPSLYLETVGEDDTVGDDYIYNPPDCPSDIKVLKTVGVTEFPPVKTTSTVSVLSKNVEDNTVTVELNQVWPDSSIDAIYYQWFPDYLNEKCLQETDVASGETYAEITLQCHFLEPFAKMTICLEESVEAGFLQAEDDATVPKCCHDGESSGNLAMVCYTLEIQCAPGCLESDAQQAVRRKRKLRGVNDEN